MYIPQYKPWDMYQPVPSLGMVLAGTSRRARIGLIQVKEEGWTRFSKGWQGCSKWFPEGYPEEQPCQPEDNPIHPDSITWIYILFETGNFVDISEFFK